MHSSCCATPTIEWESPIKPRSQPKSFELSRREENLCSIAWKDSSPCMNMKKSSRRLHNSVGARHLFERSSESRVPPQFHPLGIETRVWPCNIVTSASHF